jgi:NTP pyrophosphatase (non-canonical NTP hydrolase)
MTMNNDEKLRQGLTTLARESHEMARGKGFWDHDKRDAECIALIHSELSEALEAMRDDNPESHKIRGYSQAEEELADAVIRIADLCGANWWDLGGAVVAKLRYNSERPHKHGRGF